MKSLSAQERHHKRNAFSTQAHLLMHLPLVLHMRQHLPGEPKLQLDMP
jgi:hypothetical protein